MSAHHHQAAAFSSPLLFSVCYFRGLVCGDPGVCPPFCLHLWAYLWACLNLLWQPWQHCLVVWFQTPAAHLTDDLLLVGGPVFTSRPGPVLLWVLFPFLIYRFVFCMFVKCWAFFPFSALHVVTVKLVNSGWNGSEIVLTEFFFLTVKWHSAPYGLEDLSVILSTQ